MEILRLKHPQATAMRERAIMTTELAQPIASEARCPNKYEKAATARKVAEYGVLNEALYPVATWRGTWEDRGNSFAAGLDFKVQHTLTTALDGRE